MRVLVAVDGSDHADSVVSQVGSWLGDSDAAITLLTVLDASEMHGVLQHTPEAAVERWSSIELHEPVPSKEPPTKVVEYKSQAVDYAVAEARAGLERLARLVPGQHQCDVRVEVNDDASAAILRVAREVDADTIAVGTHGRTGVRRALLGSIAEAVVRHSDRPIMVVPLTAGGA